MNSAFHPYGHFMMTSDSAVLYYELYGEEHTDTASILLIPGFCCSTAFFKNNVAALSESHRVLTYDPRGQGNSSKGLQNHTLRRNAEDVHELLTHVGMDRVCLLGWSMAGQIVLTYYDLYGSDRLESIVLADCPLGAMYDREWNAHGLKGGNMDLFNAHLAESYAEYDRYCEGFAKKIWSGIDDSLIEWSTDEFLKTPPWISFAIYSDMVFTNCFPILKTIDIPIAFMGADSRVTVNGKALAEKWYPAEIREGVRKASFTFEKGGHVFFFVEHALFNERLLEFIRG